MELTASKVVTAFFETIRLPKLLFRVDDSAADSHSARDFQRE